MTQPLVLRALHHESVERPPVWLMRQAGRYLTEYQNLKSRHSFLEMCKTTELALEVSLQPVRILDVDAAIVFSDILLPLEALGISIDFTPGPVIHNPIRTPADAAALHRKSLSAAVYPVYETLSLLRSELDVQQKAVIGFSGAPWTLACYMIEQGPHKHFQGTVIFAKQHRQVHDLLGRITEVIAEYVVAQVAAGAQVIQLFDTWAGILAPDDYREFALPYCQQIFALLKGSPTVLYINGSAHLLSEMAGSGASCLSLDWRTPLADVEAQLPAELALQGNLDLPCFLPRKTSSGRKPRKWYWPWRGALVMWRISAMECCKIRRVKTSWRL